ncbi:MAG: response regulator transcription factor [Acutalibacteraceae bacterium]|nr:response regulator transcription factor [Acutalibacteraceae bacterium]
MENKNIKIIVADDEQRLRELVRDFLCRDGYTVLLADDGYKAVELVEQNPDVALVILDVMMPELDGWAACRKIREISNVLVMMLTARSEDFDQIMAFESGADDYVTKPFSPAVLIKRIEALLKRSKGSFGGKKQGLYIDSDAYTAYLDGDELDLTVKEFEILRLLNSNVGRVFTRSQLLDIIWGYDYDGDTRVVDSHIARLRTKLGDFGAEKLKTVYGIGYKIEG